MKKNTKSNGTSLNLEEFLPYRLSVLSKRISGAIAENYGKKFSLSIQEWRVMAILGGEPGLSALEITEKTAMDKVAVSRAVSKLLSSGRIKREFAQDDQRRSIISLSPKGQEVYDQVVPLAKRYEALLLKELSPTEGIQLDNLLTKLEDIQLHLHDF